MVFFLFGILVDWSMGGYSPGYTTDQIELHYCIITCDFITKLFVDMLIAEFIFSFFTQTHLLNAFFYYHSGGFVSQ